MPMSIESLSLQHLVRQPETEQVQRHPPLLVLLHGLRSNEYDLFALTPYLDERFMVVSVRAPLKLGVDQYAWYGVAFLEGRMERNAAEFERGCDALHRFIDEAVRVYDADPARVHLMGFSQGAVMSLAMLLTQPELVRGVVAMSGALPYEAMANVAAPERLQNKEVLVVHGEYDAMLPISEGREVQRYLETLPCQLTYREYPMRHEISDDSLDDVCGWLIERLNEDETPSAALR